MGNPLFWVSLLGLFGIAAFLAAFIAQSGLPLWAVMLAALAELVAAVKFWKARRA